MPEYVPYTYLIGWSTRNVWYYGSETGIKTKVANPENFWKTYFTSSKTVQSYRKLYGEPDFIQIRKTFKDGESCLKWERRVLQRMQVVNDPKWLNLSTGGSFNSEIVSKANLGNSHRKGKKLSPEHIDAIRTANLGNTRLKGSRKGPLAEETKKKISEANKGKPKPPKIRQTLSERCCNWNKVAWNKGKSNVKMRGTKFYNNGVQQKMFREGSQPENWIKGRLNARRT